MTITEILEQVKTLPLDERRELAKLIIDTLESHPMASPKQQPEHWGQDLLRTLDDIGPVDLIYPEIEDPVDWVQQIRADQQRKRHN